jgi:hypothetical protein
MRSIFSKGAKAAPKALTLPRWPALVAVEAKAAVRKVFVEKEYAK